MSAAATASSSISSFGAASHQVDPEEMERRVCAIDENREHGQRGCCTPSEFSSESLAGIKVAADSSQKSHVAFEVPSGSAATRLLRAREHAREIVYQWSVRTVAFAIFSCLFVGTLAIGYYSQLG